MSNLPWFRLYSEFAFDPKVQALDEVLQRRYVMLLCLKCNGDLRYVTECNENVTLKVVTTALRVTEEEALKTKKILMDFGFIDENWNIHGWEKRQFISDLRDPSNKERQRRYRERKRNGAVTEEKRPDTDTDTDIKQSSYEDCMSAPSSRTPLRSEQCRFEEFWVAYPRHEKKKNSREVWKRKKLDRLAGEIIADVEKRKALHAPWQEGFVPHATTYLNGELWNDEITQKSEKPRGTSHATNQPKSRADMLFESCAPGAFAGTIFEKELKQSAGIKIVNAEN